MFLVGSEVFKSVNMSWNTLYNQPNPLFSTVQPRTQPTAQKWFFILWNLGTRHLFSYLWVSAGLGFSATLVEVFFTTSKKDHHFLHQKICNHIFIQMVASTKKFHLLSKVANIWHVLSIHALCFISNVYKQRFLGLV